MISFAVPTRYVYGQVALAIGNCRAGSCIEERLQRCEVSVTRSPVHRRKTADFLQVVPSADAQEIPDKISVAPSTRAEERRFSD